MKRLNDASIEQPNKRMRPNLPIEPWKYLLMEPELWGKIVGFLSSSQALNLLSTSSFFADTIRGDFKQAIFLDLIRQHIFDYADDSELANVTQLPMNRAGFTEVVNHFVTKLQETVTNIKKIQPQRSNFMNKYDFQTLLSNGIRQGNILIVKKLKQSFPILMEKCINRVDLMEMTPFAYAAALGRDGICCEILSQQCDPFEQEINYDMGATFNFAMRSIHIPALRSNKNLLLHIFNDYADTLGDVCAENYEEVLRDILENRHEPLEQKLAEDESLLQAVDNGFWTLVQWASCFPESIGCLELLLQKEALRQHENSPSVTYIACAAGNLLALKTLIKAGEKIEPFMNNNNGLHLSAYNGHADITEYLITQGNQAVNTLNDRDETPVMMARMTHNFGRRLSPDMLAKKARCVEILLANGAIEEAHAAHDSSDDSESIFELDDLFKIS